MSTTFCFFNISGHLMYSYVHCWRQSMSCQRRLSLDQSSIAHHCCPPLSLHLLLSSLITSPLTFLSCFLTLLSFVWCPWSDSSFWTLIFITFNDMRVCENICNQRSIVAGLMDVWSAFTSVPQKSLLGEKMCISRNCNVWLTSCVLCVEFSSWSWWKSLAMMTQIRMKFYNSRTMVCEHLEPVLFVEVYRNRFLTKTSD